MKQRLIDLTRCPECGNPHMIRDEDRGELVCSRCGLVIRDDMLDRKPEWRAFTPEEKRAKQRTGPPTDYTRYDKGLSTTIKVDRDAFGRPLSPDVKRQMWRLRRWHIRSRIHKSKSRNLMRAMNELERISERLHVPSAVQGTAAMIYRKALDEDLIRGRSIDAVIASSLYAACRLAHIPKSLDDLAKASTRDKKEIAQAYRLLLRRLRIKMPLHDPLYYVSKIAEKTQLSGEIRGLATRLLQKARHKGLTAGKDPRGVAAAVLYIASKLKGKRVAQKQIASASGVTEVTLRNRKKELVKGLELNL